MKKSILQICTLALGLAGAQAKLPAQDTHTVRGVWDVSVTVVDCQTGAVIRTVRSLQMYLGDGSFTETASTFLRGSSVGTWKVVGAPMYSAAFWFFRYNTDGTFASIAQASNAVTLSQDGSQFSASGTVQDFDANNVLISTGCVVQQATRRAPSPAGS